MLIVDLVLKESVSVTRVYLKLPLIQFEQASTFVEALGSPFVNSKIISLQAIIVNPF